MKVMPPFNLFVPHPQATLSLPAMANSPITRYQNTLIMIATCEGDSNDILKELEYLTDPVVIVSYCMLYCPCF